MTAAPTLMEWLLHYRPFVELLAVVLLSATVGFITARAIYSSKVTNRTELLRREQNIWRRRLSSSRSEHRRAVSETDRMARRLKRDRDRTAT